MRSWVNRSLLCRCVDYQFHLLEPSQQCQSWTYFQVYFAFRNEKYVCLGHSRRKANHFQQRQGKPIIFNNDKEIKEQSHKHTEANTVGLTCSTTGTIHRSCLCIHPLDSHISRLPPHLDLYVFTFSSYADDATCKMKVNNTKSSALSRQITHWR